jgi:hypothetical protein
MRKLPRENIVGKINGNSEEQRGRSVHVRPYASDEKKLEEIARHTGESKAAIVRRMIRFALSDKYEHFSANPCRDRLDLLIEQSRESESERIVEMLELIKNFGEDQKAAEQKAIVFMREIYSLSGLSVLVLNIVLARMIELTSPGGTDKEKISLIANGAMKSVITQTILDLDKCCSFHGIDSGPQLLDELYFATRINGLASTRSGEKPLEGKPL